MKTRVVQVVEATIGGTRRHVLDLLSGLDRSRFEPALVASSERDPAFRDKMRELAAGGVEVHEVPMRRRISPLRDLVCLGRLEDILSRGRFDVIHAHSSKGGYLARWAARRRRFRGRIFYTPHGPAFINRELPLPAAFYAWAERRAARWGGKLIALTQAEKRALLDAKVAGPGDVVVIPNGIDAGPFASLPDGRSSRRELGLPAGGIVVGAAGRFVPQKGMDVLVRAAGVLAREVTVALAGAGPWERRLRREAAPLGERVAFLGELDGMMGFYAAIDIFVLPSRWEAMPYALLEAAAAGRACIASRLPGLEEILPEGEGGGGLFFPEGDHEELARTIGRLAKDDALRLGIAEAGKKRVAREFPLDRMIQRISRLYETGETS